MYTCSQNQGWEQKSSAAGHPVQMHSSGRGALNTLSKAAALSPTVQRDVDTGEQQADAVKVREDSDSVSEALTKHG